MSKQPEKPAPATTETDVARLNFEQALREIEAIIERIETGEVGLEDSLKEYERGVGLVNHCRAKLDKAQQQVEDLTRRLEAADDDEPDDEAGEPAADEDENADELAL